MALRRYVRSELIRDLRSKHHADDNIVSSMSLIMEMFCCACESINSLRVKRSEKGQTDRRTNLKDFGTLKTAWLAYLLAIRCYF